MPGFVGVDDDGVSFSGEMIMGVTIGWITVLPFRPGVKTVAVVVSAERSFVNVSFRSKLEGFALSLAVPRFRFVGEHIGGIVIILKQGSLLDCV